VIQTTTD